MTDHIKIDAEHVLHSPGTTRKDVEKAVREHINSIWHGIDDTVTWPRHKLDALLADLKKHLP